MRDPKAEAKRWLAAAREELAWARHAAAGGFHAPACFHAQQGAEKAVKAVHFLRGARVVIGHNVRALIESLEPRVSALDALADAGRELDLFYIPTRYPNGLDSGTPGEAFSASQSRRAIEHIAAIVDAAAQAVEPPAKPSPCKNAAGGPAPTTSAEAPVDDMPPPEEKQKPGVTG